MKKKKDRVIALDYFRGICILIILLSHSAQFSYPIAYLSGMGLLWTSAAEMFFLLSGITLGVVRNDLANQNFKLLINKCWHRAATIYVLYIVTVIVSMSLGLFLTGRGLNVDMVWSAPKTTGMHLIFQILNFSYISGLAAFLMYYSVFMIFAPFLIYAIKTRLWPIILLSSGLIYTLGVSYPLQPSPLGIYGTFATWQIYFVIGIVLARFRQEIIHWFYSLPKRASKLIGYSLITVVGAITAIGVLLAVNFYPVINQLAIDGRLPHKIRNSYVRLINHKPAIDDLFMNSRAGILRPFVAILFLAAAYWLYQKYKQPILRTTGNFVNAFGRDTLWLFVAQAFAIPILAALPIQRNIINNLVLTSFFFGLMVLINRRSLIVSNVKNRTKEFKTAASAKYLYGAEDI